MECSRLPVLSPDRAMEEEGGRPYGYLVGTLLVRLEYIKLA